MNESVSAHYQGLSGEKYFRYQNRYASLRAHLKAKRFVDYIGRDYKVLDYGCGGGWLLAALNCRLRVGVEINRVAHASCQKNGVRVFRSLHEVSEDSFDAVISCHCLEHVPNPTAVLAEASTHLQSKGKLILLLPIDDWRAQRKYTKEDVDHHLHTWTPLLIGNTLSEAGFEVETIRILTRQWFPKWNYLIGKIPMFLFNFFCFAWGVIGRQREMLVVGAKV